MSPEQTCRVPQLVAEGRSNAEIANEMQVSAAAIRKCIKEQRWLKHVEEPVGVQERCPDCGGLVADDLKPCMKCEIERMRKHRQRFRLIGMA